MRRNVEAIRAFHRRGAANAARNARERPRVPLQRKRRAVRSERPSAALALEAERPEGYVVLSARRFRAIVWALDGGRCVGCDKEVPEGGGLFVWQVHHPLPRQHLPTWLHRDPRAGVTACTPCHMNHENASPRIAGERLPLRVRELSAELGVRAMDLLDRLHPRGPTDQEVTPDG